MNPVWEVRLRTTARWLTVLIPVFLVSGRAAADSAMSFVAILFLLRNIGTGDWSWTKRTWFRIAFVLWLWMLLISNFAYHVGPSYTEALTWLRFLLFAAAAEAWLLNGTWLRRLLYVTGATLLFTASDAIFQYISGHDIFMHVSVHPNRLTGPFRAEEVGIFLARLYFPVVLGGFAITASRPRLRVLVFVGAVLLLTAIFLSGERAAFLLTLLGIAVTVAFWKGARLALSAALVPVVALSLLIAFAPNRIPIQYSTTVTMLPHFWHSDYGHLWETGLMMGKTHPLTGVGLNNFRYVCKAPGTHYPSCNLHPHNMYIQWFAELGIPGLLGFLILVGSWYRRFWRELQRRPRNAWILGAATGVFIQLWPFITTGSFFSNWNAVTFWLVLGWAMASINLHVAEHHEPMR